MKAILLGYRRYEFSPEDKPDSKISGFSLYLAVETRGVTGFAPSRKDGKAVSVSDRTANELGITRSFLDARILKLLDVGFDIDGKLDYIADLGEVGG